MTISAITASSSAVITAPVGLFGNGRTRIFDFGVIYESSFSFVSLKLSFSSSGIGTGTPFARMVHGT